MPMIVRVNWSLLSLIEVSSTRMPPIVLVLFPLFASFRRACAEVQEKHQKKNDNERKRGRGRETSTEITSVCVRVRRMSLYILHIYTHFQTFLFLLFLSFLRCENTSIYLSLYFCFRRLLACPPFLFCSFHWVPSFPFLPLSLSPRARASSFTIIDKRTQEFVCVSHSFSAARISPRSLSPSFLSVYSRSHSCICRRQMRARAHTDIQRKKTESEEDEHPYTIVRKSSCCFFSFQFF